MRITLAEGPITGLNTYPDNGIPEVSVGRGRVDFPLPLDCDPATIAPHFGKPVRVVLESVEGPVVTAVAGPTIVDRHLRRLLEQWHASLDVEGVEASRDLYRACVVRLGGEGE